MNIPAELEARVEEAISHYPVSKRSAALPLLHLFQEHYGRIKPEMITWIAEKLELQPINILEIVTFYPMFRQKSVGKFHIRVCRTLSCALAGSHALLEKFKQVGGIEPNQPGDPDPHIECSPDGRFSVEFVECLACCGSAPVCMVNDTLHEKVSQDSVSEILNNCQS